MCGKHWVQWLASCGRGHEEVSLLDPLGGTLTKTTSWSAGNDEAMSVSAHTLWAWCSYPEWLPANHHSTYCSPIGQRDLYSKCLWAFNQQHDKRFWVCLTMQSELWAVADCLCNLTANVFFFLFFFPHIMDHYCVLCLSLLRDFKKCQLFVLYDGSRKSCFPRRLALFSSREQHRWLCPSTGLLTLTWTILVNVF